MTDAASLAELRARVEAATGPDRELDAAVMFDLFAKPCGQREEGGPVGYLWPEDNPSWSFAIRFPGRDREWFQKSRAKTDGETLLIWRDDSWVLVNSLRVPKLSASLDAALALVERVLPGWSWGVSGATKPVCDALLYEPSRTSRSGFRQKIKAPGATPALALLSAMLAALSATPTPGDGGDGVP